jgi:hypothetical protein
MGWEYLSIQRTWNTSQLESSLTYTTHLPYSQVIPNSIPGSLSGIYKHCTMFKYGVPPSKIAGSAQSALVMPHSRIPRRHSTGPCFRMPLCWLCWPHVELISLRHLRWTCGVPFIHFFHSTSLSSSVTGVYCRVSCCLGWKLPDGKFQIRRNTPNTTQKVGDLCDRAILTSAVPVPFILYRIEPTTRSCCSATLHFHHL